MTAPSTEIAAAGDPPDDVARPAIAELYADHAAFVWRASAYLGVPAAQLDDAVQEVFLVAHRRLHDFAARSSLRTWLFGIARRVAFRLRRTQSRAQTRAAAIAALPIEPFDLEHWYAHREAGDRVLQAIAELEPDQRLAFVLGDLEGLTRAELGVALGVNENTAWARVRTARAKLARTFGDTVELHALLEGTAGTLGPSARRKSAIWIALAPKLAMTGTTAVTSWAAALVVAIGLVGGASIVARDRTPIVTASAGLATFEPPAPTPTTVHPAAAVGETPAVAAAIAPASVPVVARARGEVPALPSTPTITAAPEGVTAREQALALAARAALARNDPTSALAEIASSRREFPDSAHAEERDALGIVALCALGRTAEADVEIAAFDRAHAGSPLLRKIRDACARPNRPQPETDER